MVEFTTLFVQVVLMEPISTVDSIPDNEIIFHSITGVQFPTNLTLHHIRTLECSRFLSSSTTSQRGLDSKRRKVFPQFISICLHHANQSLDKFILPHKSALHIRVLQKSFLLAFKYAPLPWCGKRQEVVK